jgi:hypothetical protein
MIALTHDPNASSWVKPSPTAKLTFAPRRLATSKNSSSPSCRSALATSAAASVLAASGNAASSQQATNLFLLEDLQDVSKLVESDLNALQETHGLDRAGAVLQAVSGQGACDGRVLACESDGENEHVRKITVD